MTSTMIGHLVLRLKLQEQRLKDACDLRIPSAQNNEKCGL